MCIGTFELNTKFGNVDFILQTQAPLSHHKPALPIDAPFSGTDLYHPWLIASVHCTKDSDPCCSCCQI